MRRLPFIKAGLLLLTCLLWAYPLQAKPPAILVTIKPVHSLISNLTRGISQPMLLIEGTQSPHDYALKPSDRRLLNEADLIIYVSPSIEGFMHNLEHKLVRNKLVSLIDTPGLQTLTTRTQHDHPGAEHHEDDRRDGHIWLSVNNARIISQYVYEKLIKFDAPNQWRYASNLQRLNDELGQLEQELKQQLTAIKNQPFLIYHDAFQYFEQEQELSRSFFVTPSPEQQPGIKQVRFLRSIIQQNNIKCVYYEPPYVPGIIETIAEGQQQLNVLPLDPSGALLSAGDRLYFTLMRNIARQLQTCLGS
ncbi:MAG: hypothetical protein EP315_08750 [Gammaproteobacteria bacterium]|nr:MAG: hypothetical protein EP315_08750 [Gammaproteobacteria bacterium]